MKLLIIFGPPAVGKTTIGQCIEKKTEYRLFHNHMILDGVMHIFGKNTPAENRLSRSIREQVITEAANSNIDLIFTYVWNFSLEKGKNNIDAYKEQYEARGGKVYFVELTAPLATRIDRANSPNRFDYKIHTADGDEVGRAEQEHKFTSPSPFFYPKLYLQIDTTDRTPDDIANEVIDWQTKAD
jgi:hypothetical protein